MRQSYRDKESTKFEGSYKVVIAKQKNYSSYILPKELWSVNEDSLYKLVARWSLIKGDFICCDDVATNFGISKRQASNIISNIHRKHTDFATCVVKKVKVGRGNVFKTYIKVTDIFEQDNSSVKPINKTITQKNVQKNKSNGNGCWEFLSQKWS